MPPIPISHGSIGFGQTFSDAAGTTITTGTSNNKGTPVELIASTPFDAHWVEVMIGRASGAVPFLIDIMVGAATEQIIIPDLVMRGRGTNDGGSLYLFPIFIPKGSRISARAQSSSSGATIQIAVSLFNSGIANASMSGNVVQYGSIASSLTPSLDPGAVAHTKSSPVEMTASTVSDHHWLALSVSNSDTLWSGYTMWLLDILIGSSTEEVLVGNISFGGSGSTDVIRPANVFHMPVFVPKGSRLSVRAQSNSVNSGDRTILVSLYGV